MIGRCRNACRIILAAGWIAITLGFMWLAGFAQYTISRPQIPAIPSLEAPDAGPKPVAATPEPRLSSLAQASYVASEIGKSYHDASANCFYVRKQAKHLTRHFASKESAEAAGLRPCSNCLSTARSTPAGPLAQAPR